ncbi:MAG TPA: CotH kinase family protein [Gemmatales bacterium]|nr:CotH kinase family protein [Gemmatales bacterium]
MKLLNTTILGSLTLSSIILAATTYAQPPGGGQGGGPGGDMMRGPGGPGMMRQTRKILKDFDKNNDGWLNTEERAAAREALKKQQAEQGGFGGRGGFGPPGMNRNQTPPKPGVHVEPSEVKSYSDAKLYDPTVLRTIFIDFENRKDWESELEDFHGTDADVAATITVDGKKYSNVGVRFRGMSSYMMVGKGFKRSLNLNMDMADGNQRLYGYKTLNLLNSHEDATYLSSVLYSHIARQYIPAPKANMVKVVINGENWGIYVNVEQFNKDFLSENYHTTKGTRWKVTGSPMGRGGLEYIGEDVEQYKRRYDIKSNDNAKSWKALIHLCKVLNQTPPDKLEEALKPILDIDNALWFIALDVAVINCDGYWTRASDYSIYLDDAGKFHIIPHDMNECFRTPGGLGMGGGFMMMRPNPGEVLPAFFGDMLRLTEDQKKQLAVIQKETDAELAKILNTKQKEQIKAMRAGPGGPGGMAGGPPGAGGPGGPGMGGPGGGGMGQVKGVELDPLVGLNDTTKPLRSKLLALPALREKYLRNIRTIAEKSFDWKALEPVVAQYRALIDKEVEMDTRKLESYEEFLKFTAGAVSTAPEPPRRGPSSGMNIRAFAEQRQKYLLNYPEIKKLAGK